LSERGSGAIEHLEHVNSVNDKQKLAFDKYKKSDKIDLVTTIKLNYHDFS